MSTLHIIDAIGSDVYLSGTGTGTSGDPFVPIHKPKFDTSTVIKVDFASTSEQTIIVAPAAGYRTVIQSIFLTCGVNNIVVMKSGSTEIGKAYVYGFSKDYVHGLVLGEAEAFKLTATTADPIYGQVCYYTEAV